MGTIGLRRIVAIALAGVLLLGTRPTAVAAEPAALMKPVVVATLAGYDELYRDIDYLGQVSGNPDLARGIEGLVAIFTQLQGLVGLDKMRPLGAAVRSDGRQFQIFAFLPVNNIKQLFSALSGIVNVPEKIGDRQWRIRTRAGTAFIRQQGDWAFIAQLEDQLNDLPDDPAAMLGDLPKHYDLAVRLFVQDIPEPLRDMMFDQLSQKLPATAKSDAGKPVHPLSHHLRSLDGRAIAGWLAQLDQLTLGFALDPAGRRTYLDFSFTALPGSQLAALAAASPLLPTKMAGFLLPEAPFSLHLNRRLPPGAIERDVALVQLLKRSLKLEIENSPRLKTEEEKVRLSGWVDDVATALAATFEKGHTSAGVAVRNGSVAVGFEIEKTDLLEKIVREASKLAQADPQAQVRLNVQALGDVRFHTFSMPTDQWLPEDLGKDDLDELADVVREALGPETHVTIGIAPGRGYLAIGSKGLAVLKQAIGQSQKPSTDKARLRVRLALGEFLQWWLSAKANPIWGQVADELAASGKDHLVLTATPVSTGFRVRLEGEEGVVKALGVGLKMMAAGGRGGF